MKTNLYLIEFYTNTGDINFAWVLVEDSAKFLVKPATRAREVLKAVQGTRFDCVILCDEQAEVSKLAGNFNVGGNLFFYGFGHNTIRASMSQEAAVEQAKEDIMDIQASPSQVAAPAPAVTLNPLTVMDAKARAFYDKVAKRNDAADSLVKVKSFALRVSGDQYERGIREGFTHDHAYQFSRTSVKPGLKFTKVDINDGGRYMVENKTGNIFGIKGYGTPHKGHFYGTLDTINDYNWGDYYPRHKTSPTKLSGGIPVLTYAPGSVEQAKKDTKIAVAGIRFLASLSK